MIWFWVFILGVFAGALFVSVFDWAYNLWHDNEEYRRR